jgi:hypothetical protein
LRGRRRAWVAALDQQRDRVVELGAGVQPRRAAPCPAHTPTPAGGTAGIGERIEIDAEPGEHLPGPRAASGRRHERVTRRDRRRPRGVA